MTLKSAAAVSLSEIFAVAMSVLIVTSGLLGSLICAITVSVVSRTESSSTSIVIVPLIAPSAIVICVVPSTAV